MDDCAENFITRSEQMENRAENFATHCAQMGTTCPKSEQNGQPSQKSGQNDKSWQKTSTK